MKYIDILLAQKLGGGGNPEITVEELNVTENGTYVAGAGKAYNPVKVDMDVPEIEQLEATENTTYTAPEGKAYGSVIVNVPSSSQALDELIQGTATSITSNATKVGSYAFYKNGTLENISLPNATEVGMQAFDDCTKLRSITSPNLEIIKDNAFEDTSTLSEINFPNAITINQYAFNGSGIQSFNLPELTGAGQYAFRNCRNLVQAILPKLNSFISYLFYNCTNLELVDCSSSKSISSNTFYACSKLNTVIIRKNTVCSLDNINAFTYTPFASGGTGGVLYVPQNLINSYKNSGRWSTILGYENNQILAIEGSIYE